MYIYIYIYIYLHDYIISTITCHDQPLNPSLPSYLGAACKAPAHGCPAENPVGYAAAAADVFACGICAFLLIVGKAFLGHGFGEPGNSNWVFHRDISDISWIFTGKPWKTNHDHDLMRMCWMTIMCFSPLCWRIGTRCRKEPRGDCTTVNLPTYIHIQWRINFGKTEASLERQSNGSKLSTTFDQDRPKRNLWIDQQTIWKRATVDSLRIFLRKAVKVSVGFLKLRCFRIRKDHAKGPKTWCIIEQHPNISFCYIRDICGRCSATCVKLVKETGLVTIRPMVSSSHVLLPSPAIEGLSQIS